MVCTYDLAFPIGVTFFTIALTLNAVRWVYQIIFLQNGYETKYLNKASLLTVGVLFTVILATVSIMYMAHQCENPDVEKHSYKIIKDILFAVVT